MRTRIQLAGAVAAVAVLCVSCAALEDVFFEQDQQSVITPAKTNLVAEVSAAGLTNWVFHVEPARTNIVRHYYVRPEVTLGLEVGKASPVPWLATALSLVGFGLTGYANVKNKGLARGLVGSVERARRAIRETPEGRRIDDKFVSVLEQRQGELGILKQVVAELERSTGTTRKADGPSSS